MAEEEQHDNADEDGVQVNLTASTLVCFHVGVPEEKFHISE